MFKSAEVYINGKKISRIPAGKKDYHYRDDGTIYEIKAFLTTSIPTKTISSKVIRVLFPHEIVVGNTYRILTNYSPKYVDRYLADVPAGVSYHHFPLHSDAICKSWIFYPEAPGESCGQFVEDVRFSPDSGFGSLSQTIYIGHLNIPGISFSSHKKAEKPYIDLYW